jgi:hypothetical protein
MTTVERMEYWTEQVERWEAEGGSRKVFCEEHGIGYASFLSWCKRLRPDGITFDNSDTLTCVEVTNKFSDEIDDARLMIESATLTINGSDAQITVRGRMTMASLRRIARACGTTDVPA